MTTLFFKSYLANRSTWSVLGLFGFAAFVFTTPSFGTWGWNWDYSGYSSSSWGGDCDNDWGYGDSGHDDWGYGYSNGGGYDDWGYGHDGDCDEDHSSWAECNDNDKKSGKNDWDSDCRDEDHDRDCDEDHNKWSECNDNNKKGKGKHKKGDCEDDSCENSCAVYPITFPDNVLSGLSAGQQFDIYAGSNPGNFGWLSWAGPVNEPTLETSLTPPGDVCTYINDFDCDDESLSEGDWVNGKTGISNSSGVREKLDILTGQPILIPVWGSVYGQGNNVYYKVVAFAEVEIVDYRLPRDNRITAKFLGYATCGGVTNNPPLADDQTLQTYADSSIDITLSGSDPDGDSISFSIETQPSNGTLIDLGGGTYTYLPNSGFTGNDTFTYVSNDGDLNSEIATVLISVICPIQPVETIYITNYAASINGTVEGSIQHLRAENWNLNSGATVTGSIYVPGTPTVRFNGNPDFNGVIEGSGSSWPSWNTIYLNQGSSLDHIVTRTDPQSLPSIDYPDSPSGNKSYTLNSGSDAPNWGKVKNLTLNSNAGMWEIPVGAYGNFIANTNTGFILGVEGTSEPVHYHFQNLMLNSGSRLEVVGPVVIHVKNSMSPNGPMGQEGHSDWLRFEIYNGGFTLNTPAQYLYGHVIAPSGSVIVNSDTKLCGSTVSDRLTVNSRGLLTSCSEVPDCLVNLPPVAEDLSVTTPMDTPIDVTLVGSDPDGDDLTYTIVAAPSNGSVSLVDGVVTYTPDTGYFGSDSFTYKVNDGELDSNVATVDIVVEFVNSPPTAEDLTAETLVLVPVVITLGGDDPDGDDITFEIVSQPSNGTLLDIDLVNGVVTYLPNLGFFGEDSFTYISNDGDLDSEVATVTITVVWVNSPPVTEDLFDEIYVDTESVVTLVGSDLDSDPLVFVLLDGPSNGVVSLVDGVVTYTPNSGFEGTDSYTYYASDGDLSSNVSTVTINVIPVPNQPPAAESQSITISPNQTVDITLVGSDPDLDPITYIVTSFPSNGILSGVLPSGEVILGSIVTYTPNQNYVGDDSFTFITNDGELDSVVAVVTVTMDAMGNEPPVVDAGPDELYGLNFIADVLGRAIIPLDGSASDDGLPPGSVLGVAWSLISAPAGVSISYDDQTDPQTSVIVTNPVEGFYTFRLTANDTMFTVYDEVTIELRILNEPPVVVTPGTLEVTGINVLHPITGTVTDDNFPGNPLSQTWNVIDGPGTVTITDPSSPSTTASFSTPGIYILELFADDQEYTDSDVLIVYVSITCTFRLPNSAIAWWMGKYSIDDFVAGSYNSGYPVGNLGFASGMVSLAWDFDGVDSAVFVPSGATTNVGLLNGFSLEGWVNPDVLGGTLMQWATETEAGLTISIGASGELIFTAPLVDTVPVTFGAGLAGVTGSVSVVGGRNVVTVTMPNVFQAGTLQHIMVYFDRVNGRFLCVKNGTTIAGWLTVGSHQLLTTGDIWMGSDAAGTSFYDGVLDEWTMYNTLLTPAQTNGIYQTGAIGKCPPPINQ